jgi:uncharacterized protein YbcI
MARQTRDQAEAEISQAIEQFEKEYMGRLPGETRTYIIEDMIIIRMQGAITKAEENLAGSGEGSRGRDLIKQTRIQLIEKSRPLIEGVVESIIGRSVRSLHMDISTKTGEKFIILTLDGAPDFG